MRWRRCGPAGAALLVQPCRCSRWRCGGDAVAMRPVSVQAPHVRGRPLTARRPCREQPGAPGDQTPRPPPPRARRRDRGAPEREHEPPDAGSRGDRSGLPAAQVPPLTFVLARVGRFAEQQADAGSELLGRPAWTRLEPDDHARRFDEVAARGTARAWVTAVAAQDGDRPSGQVPRARRRLHAINVEP